jgi:photosystem II stability/assembly factor-like uncharacterized protein
MDGTLLRWLAVLVIAVGARGAFPAGSHAAAAIPAQANAWQNVTGMLANMASECGNLTMLSPVPRSNAIIAGVALQGLWVNSRGSTWSHLGAGVESDRIINRPSWITYDPVHPGTFWESGTYQGGGVYQTMDNGDTFHRLGSIPASDYVSVDFRDPDRQTLLAGGHEQSRAVYLSTNGGRTWTNVGLNVPLNTNFSGDPLIVNALTYLVNASGNGPGSLGIYRTIDGGDSWKQVSALGPSGPPLVASSGAIYWPANGSLLKSTNSGVTWTRVGSNIQPVHPIELSDGRLVSVGANNLVMSADGGSTWSPFGATLPFTPGGLIYSPNRRAFFIWHSDCVHDVVLPDAVMEID